MICVVKPVRVCRIYHADGFKADVCLCVWLRTAAPVHLGIRFISSFRLRCEAAKGVVTSQTSQHLPGCFLYLCLV